jgi:hypothetical protein
MGSSPMMDIQYFFVFVTNLFFCCPYFSFMSLICPSRFIFHLVFFVFMTDLFIHLDIFCFCFCLFKLRDASTMHISNPPYGSAEYFIKSSSHCLFIKSSKELNENIIFLCGHDWSKSVLIWFLLWLAEQTRGKVDGLRPLWHTIAVLAG